ncbi:MAG: phosphatase PAP2 family protein [Clostridia bacterium]
MEIEIIKFLQSFSNETLVSIATLISHLASVYGFALMIMMLFAFSKPKFAITFGFTYGIGFGTSQLLKAIIDKPRPFEIDAGIVDYLHSYDASMPSGHMISACIMAVFLIYIITKNIRNKTLKNCLITLISILALLMMNSRQFLGQPFLSYVLVGLFFGIALAIV